MRDEMIGACMIEESVGDGGTGLICGDEMAPLGSAGNDEDIWLDGKEAGVGISSSGRAGTGCLCLAPTCRGPIGDGCCVEDLIV